MKPNRASVRGNRKWIVGEWEFLRSIGKCAHLLTIDQEIHRDLRNKQAEKSLTFTRKTVGQTKLVRQIKYYLMPSIAKRLKSQNEGLIIELAAVSLRFNCSMCQYRDYPTKFVQTTGKCAHISGHNAGQVVCSLSQL